LMVCTDIEAQQRRSVLTGAARRLRGLPMGKDPGGAPAPIALRLDDDARALFSVARHEWMQRARDVSGLPAGWAGKNPGRMLRLGLIYELLGWAARDEAEPIAVSADAIARAGAYLDYAADMLNRVTMGLALTEAEADAAVLARYLLAHRPERLNERSLYQTPGYHWARNSERRAAALAVLDIAGWIRRPEHGGSGRPRGDWQVSPRLKEAAS
jgi:hypothetical protein